MSSKGVVLRTPLSLTGSVNIGMPTVVAVVLGLLAGVASVINEVVLQASTQWHAYIAILLVFASGVGISPLVGPAFRAALHLPVWAGYLVSAGMAAAVLGLSSVQMGSLPHAIIAAVLTVLSALGFAPSTVTVAPVPPVAKHR